MIEVENRAKKISEEKIDFFFEFSPRCEEKIEEKKNEWLRVLL